LPCLTSIDLVAHFGIVCPEEPETLEKWKCNLLEFNGESDHVHLLIEYKPDICLSTLIANLKTVSSRLIRKENPDLAKKYFYGKAHFWTGSYFVASCGGVTIQQIKNYVGLAE
jgi:putative transposase